MGTIDLNSRRFGRSFPAELYTKDNALIITHTSLEEIFWNLPDDIRPDLTTDILDLRPLPGIPPMFAVKCTLTDPVSGRKYEQIGETPVEMWYQSDYIRRSFPLTMCKNMAFDRAFIRFMQFDITTFDLRALYSSEEIPLDGAVSVCSKQICTLQNRIPMAVMQGREDKDVELANALAEAEANADASIACANASVWTDDPAQPVPDTLPYVSDANGVIPEESVYEPTDGSVTQEDAVSETDNAEAVNAAAYDNGAENVYEPAGKEVIPEELASEPANEAETKQADEGDGTDVSDAIPDVIQFDDPAENGTSADPKKEPVDLSFLLEEDSFEPDTESVPADENVIADASDGITGDVPAAEESTADHSDAGFAEEGTLPAENDAGFAAEVNGQTEELPKQASDPNAAFPEFPDEIPDELPLMQETNAANLSPANGAVNNNPGAYQVPAADTSASAYPWEDPSRNANDGFPWETGQMSFSPDGQNPVQTQFPWMGGGQIPFEDPASDTLPWESPHTAGQNDAPDTGNAANEAVPDGLTKASVYGLIFDYVSCQAKLTTSVGVLCFDPYSEQWSAETGSLEGIDLKDLYDRGSDLAGKPLKEYTGLF